MGLSFSPSVAPSRIRFFPVLVFVAVVFVFSALPLFSAPSQVGDSFRERYAIFKQRGAGQIRPNNSRVIEREWAAYEYIPDLPQIVTRTRSSVVLFNQAYYRQAISHYEYALELNEEFREQLDETQRRRMNIRDRLWWKYIDANAVLSRRDFRLRHKYNRLLAMRYRRVFEALDRVQNPDLVGEEFFKKLRKTAYRSYISHQIAQGNFIPALKILQKYRRLPDVENEWPMHYYFSVAYASVFRQALRNRGVGDRRLRQIRRNKNMHMLRAVELRFGRLTPEYEAVWRRIRLDELGPPRSRTP